MKTTKQQRRDAREFREATADQARTMGVKVPAHFWCPGPNKMITAGQYVKAWKLITAAKPDDFFPRSFQSWAGRTAAEIRRYEIRPAIHDRINARGLMQTKF